MELCNSAGGGGRGGTCHIPPHHSFEVNLWGIDHHNYNFLSFCSRGVLNTDLESWGKYESKEKKKTKIGPLQLSWSRKRIRGRYQTLVTSKTSEVLPPPPPWSWAAGTHTDSYFRRGTACLRPRRSVHSHFKKNVMVPKCSLGSVDSIYVKKVYVYKAKF